MAFFDSNMTETRSMENLTVALGDVDNREDIALEDFTYDETVAYVQSQMKRSEDARLSDENRWLSSYRNYRGLYDSSVQFTEAEKSRVFIKITKTKVNAAYGQLSDVLFANNRFPIGVEPTKVPEGVAEIVHFDPQAPEQSEQEAPDLGKLYGYPGDGRDLPPGATLKDLLGPLTKDLEKLPIKEGPGKTPTAVTFEPALIAAKNLEKRINDQLGESNADKHLRHTAFECCLFGTGVMKGPLSVNKEYPKWDKEGRYDPQFKLMPRIETVSVWDFYPDPDAVSMEECEYTVQRHKYNRSQLRALKSRPYFRKEAIEYAIDNGSNYLKKWWEDDLRDNVDNFTVERWEVLEYWGILDKDIAERSGLEIPSEFEDFDQIQVNIWICGNTILRLVMNPFTPARIPYFAVPFELNPYSIFGIGVAENMEDTQMLMNGFMRMAVDNAVLSGNVVFEVDETNLVPGQDLTIRPGKVFRRMGGAPGQSIFSTKFQNVTQENMMLFDKARQLADEATGIPSFSHGQTGVTGVGRTASGISMLMGAAATNIKTVVKNVDDYLLRPLGESLAAWNYQFAPDENIMGDLEISARGTDSLMQNEIRSQRLMQFFQITAGNPNTAPLVKVPYMLREIARAMDLDPEKVVNSPEEAIIQAELMKLGQGGQGASQEGAPVGADPMDPTGAGGGNIGTGMAPPPGAPGFSGNTGGGAPQQPPSMPQMGMPQ